MTILVRMDDKMNRQLSCVVNETDTAFDLAGELVFFGFIHEACIHKIPLPTINRFEKLETMFYKISMFSSLEKLAYFRISAGFFCTF